MSQNTEFILASSSPRRKEILSYSNIPFSVVVPDVDETEIQGEAPNVMVQRLSIDKAAKVAETNESAVVLGVDTTVFQQGKILGKPTDEADAYRMLKSLQGQTHSVWCGYCMIWKSKQKQIVWQVQSKVTFTPLLDEEINAYIESKVPMDKAGAYGAQGPGMAFVERIEGSYSNVLGLDLPSVIRNYRGLVAEVRV